MGNAECCGTSRLVTMDNFRHEWNAHARYNDFRVDIIDLLVLSISCTRRATCRVSLVEVCVCLGRCTQ